MHLKMDVESLLEPGHNTVIPLKRNLRVRSDWTLAKRRRSAARPWEPRCAGCEPTPMFDVLPGAQSFARAARRSRHRLRSEHDKGG
jgi:hypothetical protein